MHLIAYIHLHNVIIMYKNKHVGIVGISGDCHRRKEIAAINNAAVYPPVCRH